MKNRQLLLLVFIVMMVSVMLLSAYLLLEGICFSEQALWLRHYAFSLFESFMPGKSKAQFIENICYVHVSFIEPYVFPLIFILLSLFLYVAANDQSLGARQRKRVAALFLFFFVGGLLVGLVYALRGHPVFDRAQRETLIGVLAPRPIEDGNSLFRFADVQGVRFKPQAAQRAKLDADAAPKLPETCYFTANDIARLSDDDAQQLVSTLAATLKAKADTLIILSSNLGSALARDYFQGTLRSEQERQFMRLVRKCVLKKLQYFGPFAQEAAGYVIGLIETRDLADTAAETLEAIGPPGNDFIPFLIGELGRDGERVCSAACRVLNCYGEMAIDAVLAAIKRSDSNYKAAVAFLVENGRRGSSAAQAALLDLAANSRPRLKETVFPVLLSAGVDENQVVLVAGAALSDERREVRVAALKVLESLGKRASPALEQLFAFVKGRPDEELARSLGIIGQVGPAATQAIPFLIDLVCRNQSLFNLACVALTRTDYDQERPVASYAQGFQESGCFGPSPGETGGNSRLAALLGVVIGMGREAAVVLREALNDPRPTARALAVSLLAEREGDDADLQTYLQKAIDDPALVVSITAGEILNRRHMLPELLAPYIRRLGSDPSLLANLGNASLMEHVALLGDDAVDLLLGYLESEQAEVCLAAAAGLDKVARISDKWTKRLVDVLSNADRYGSCRVPTLVRILGKVRPIRANVFDVLQVLADSEELSRCQNAQLAHSVVFALCNLAPEHWRALAILKGLGPKLSAALCKEVEACLYPISLPQAVEVINLCKSIEQTEDASHMASDPFTISPLMLALEKGDLEKVQTLIKTGADVNQVARSGATALSRALNLRQLAAGKVLLENGADPNRGRELPYGETPLILALGLGDQNLLVLLLEKGANPNLADKRGDTAVHHALRSGQKGMVDLLKDYGGDLSLRFCDGTRPEEMLKARNRNPW
jgi:hypothetical protein